MPPSRESYKTEVLAFVHQNFPGRHWDLTRPPHGTGHESYFARCQDKEYFVKLGVYSERYEVMSSLGLAPQVSGTGCLVDGTSIVIQEKIEGHIPTRQDFLLYLDQFARGINQTHHSAALKHILPPQTSAAFADLGLDALEQVMQRWRKFKALVPGCAAFVDAKLGELEIQIGQFPGSGLVASHNDICNGNWVVSSIGRVYLVDYESMSLDDPALDLGAILWWYYPPNLRARFLEIAGYENNAEFQYRMRLRMAVHCLNIILPRANSFDTFEAQFFDQAMEDFKAVMAGQENPQGYGD